MELLSLLLTLVLSVVLMAGLVGLKSNKKNYTRREILEREKKISELSEELKSFTPFEIYLSKKLSRRPFKKLEKN